MTSCSLLFTVVVLFAAAGASAAFAADQGTVNRMHEWTFKTTKNYADPFNEVQVDMVVTRPDGAAMKVPGFWGGGGNWRVRYSSGQVGLHRWRLECSDKGNMELNGVEGTIELAAYSEDNPLYKHGFVKVAEDKRHLQYADGTPFFWLGDTWWMGLCYRLRYPEDFQKLAEDRKAKGFTVIQIVAGLYPDMFPFDPRGANEAGFPWEEKYARIRPEYFDAVDRRIEYLADQGLTPCIVGAWGYFMPWMGVHKMEQHWRYLIARYGAMPVVWCAAGEANLNWYLDKPFPIDDRKQVSQWTEVMKYIREIDPYHRPLTIHPTGLARLSARHSTDDANLLDIDMLQTPHGQRDAVDITVKTVTESYADHPVMPVINGEAAYEMLGDNLPTRWTRQMFWLCMMNGAAGHTYGANGIWQVNRKGQPHGPSPHHAPGSVGYGVIPWDEAMNLPGSSQVAMGKKLFERFDWQKFTPHSEWASYAGDGSGKTPAWGQWIWFDEGDPTKDAPVAKRYFRKTFELPEGEVKRGTLWVSVDDFFHAYINGTAVGSRGDWKTHDAIDVTKFLKAGKNVLAVEAENRPGPPNANPAALIESLSIQMSDGKALSIASDKTWRVGKEVEAAADWKAAEFDDSQWPAAKELGPYGCNPWGTFAASASYGPFTTGSDSVRLVYVPELKSIRVLNLKADAKYRAEIFDPVSGKTTDLGDVAVDSEGGWSVAPPMQSDAEDWVLVIEGK